MESKWTIEIGQQFGHLTVLSLARKVNGFSFYLCRCECGKEKAVRKDSLYGGRVKSCGCYASQGRSQAARTHGLSRTAPEYAAWQHMISRCHKPKDKGYKLYGGRGITVSDRWRNSFENFIADMGFRPSSQHSIDRIDNDGNYEPSNCRWATTTEQATNRRNNHRISHDGITDTLKGWSVRMGLPRELLRSRLSRGWPIDIALTTPPDVVASRKIAAQLRKEGRI